MTNRNQTRTPRGSKFVRKEYTLAKPHRHRGEDLKAGDKVQLTESQAKRLAKKGKLQGVEAKPPANAGAEE